MEDETQNKEKSLENLHNDLLTRMSSKFTEIETVKERLKLDTIHNDTKIGIKNDKDENKVELKKDTYIMRACRGPNGN